MIKVIDNFISLEKANELYDHILYNERFVYGEKDYPNSVPVGMVCELKSTFYKKHLEKDCSKDNDILNCKGILRCYVNLFMPNDRPYFHYDNINDYNILTCLIYLSPEYSIDEGGETQFIVDNEIKGIRSVIGRAVIFDGSLLHRATSFRNYPRLTLAVKYIKNDY